MRYPDFKKKEDSKFGLCSFFCQVFFILISVCRTRPPLVLIILDNTKLIFKKIKYIHSNLYTFNIRYMYIFFVFRSGLEELLPCFYFHFLVLFFFCILNIIHFKMMGCFVSVGYKSDNVSDKTI